MQKVHVKKDDTVLVLSGKDKGKKAKVLSVMPKDQLVLVDGVNVKKKHTRPRPPKIPQGGILEKAAPVHSGKLMLVCSKCSRPTRIEHKFLPDGKKVRICKKCGEEI